MNRFSGVEVPLDDIRQADMVELEKPEPSPGQVLLKLERFALTTNNVTYAAAGRQLGYWNFFPASRPGFGVVPVWGFARVEKSGHPGVEAGERFYGFFPMAEFVELTPGNVGPKSIVDAAPHRADLPPVYNEYHRLGSTGGNEDQEDLRALLQPLLVTSWLLYDFLEDNGWFGADQVIIGSASSKTGLGLAKYLAEARPNGPEVVGLTSAGNVGFVRKSGAFDRIVTYGDIEKDIERKTSVFVDMAGNADVRRRLHEHLSDRMVHSAAVGTSHWDRFAPTGDLPGAKPQFFFAPAQIVKRRKDWGGDVVQRKIADAWQRLAGQSRDWMSVVRSAGIAGARDVYRDLAAGRQSPDKGHVIVV